MGCVPAGLSTNLFVSHPAALSSAASAPSSPLGHALLQAGFLASLDAVHVARELLVPVLLGLVLGMKTSSQLRGHQGKTCGASGLGGLLGRGLEPFSGDVVRGRSGPHCCPRYPQLPAGSVLRACGKAVPLV